MVNLTITLQLPFIQPQPITDLRYLDSTVPGTSQSFVLVPSIAGMAPVAAKHRVQDAPTRLDFGPRIAR